MSNSKVVVSDRIASAVPDRKPGSALTLSELLIEHAHDDGTALFDQLTCCYIPGNGSIKLWHRLGGDGEAIEIDADQAEWLLKALPPAVKEMREDQPHDHVTG